ncbi:MAG TPA: hypothetical protein PL116_05750, partial [Candidatus Cloacimonas sp.]|nr:hypothetical protein [Candidatus Cloacimonas sp.]
MKRKFRTTLFLVVLFVLTATSLFAAPPVLTSDNISAVPESGSLTIGSTITITATDVNNITNPDLQFQGAKVDLTQLGGPTELEMNKISNAPGQGRWRISYTVTLGSIDGVANRQFSVTAYNADGETNTLYPNTYTVDNVPSMNNSDFVGTPYLRINDSNSLETMKAGDTVHLIASFKPYIQKVWIDWGATFTGGPIMEYTVNASGTITASYTGTAGSLLGNYNSDLSVKIIKMQSITTDAGGPYLSSPSWFRSVSKNSSGFPIAADLNPPSVIDAWDLYYSTADSLRFSPGGLASVDGYNTFPNTFDIYLKLPDWGELGGPTEITLSFFSENRFPTFERTFSLMDSPPTVTALSGDVLKITWDGKNAQGQVISPNGTVTIGITLKSIKDFVGNAAILTQDPENAGIEFPPYGNMNDPANHALIHHSGELPHVGHTIFNRIHVVIDNVAPTYAMQPTLTNTNNSIITRLINDEDNDGVWDTGEQIYYNNSNNEGISSVIDFTFQTERQYSQDDNNKRHEYQHYWIVVEKEGTSPVERWYWTGSGWDLISNFNQAIDIIQIPFVTNPNDGGNQLSDLITINWDLGTLPSTIFSGSIGTGTTYKITAYVQDTAGNIVRSDQNLEVSITDVYMNIPYVQNINITSEHASGLGGLPITTGGVKNFYLNASYGDDDPSYAGPYTGQYYDTEDEVTIEIEVNDKNYLRETQSVELRFTQLDIPNPKIRYINRDQFDADNKATITISADDIPTSKGSVSPGTQWEVGGANLANNYIQVISHAIEYGVQDTLSFNALGSCLFNLVIPPAPDYPDPNWDVYNLAVSDTIFSPGDPRNTYDAVANPANDGLDDITDISFTIPDGSYISWRLEITDEDNLIRQWYGHINTETPFTPLPFTFNGLSQTLIPAVGPLDTKPLTVTLYIEPDPMSDPGYLPPPANIYPYIDITVDNTNPTLISGPGTTIDNTDPEMEHKIVLSTGTPVVTEMENTLMLTVYTNEPLPDNFEIAGGWQALIRGKDDFNHFTEIINPTNNDTVTATINNVTASPDNKTFNITISVNHLAGTVTYQDAILALRLPWDNASNPGRYNNPSALYTDIYHQDSAEYYLIFNILDGKPKIDYITFSHRGVEGKASYNAGIWDSSYIQSWVGPWIAAPSDARKATLIARVTGGAYRNMNTTWTADLRALLGIDATNANVPPTTAIFSGNTPNESRVWTLTWELNIPETMANGFQDNSMLNIPITIITRDGNNPIAHMETKNISIKVDKKAPTVSATATAILADGNQQNYNLTVSDGSGSGVYWDTVQGNPYGFVGETLTLTPSTDMTLLDIGNATFKITILSNTAVKYFSAQYVVRDKMGNVFTYTRYLNVDPIPNLSNVSINTGAGYYVPGRSLVVSWSLSYSQRATGGLLTLSAPGVDLSSYNRNLTAAQLQNGSYTYTSFINDTSLDGKILTATVTGWTTGYSDPTSPITSNRNFTYGNNYDTITVDTKPVINSVTFKLNGTIINHLVPNNMTGITIEATVTSPNPLREDQTTIAMISPSGTLTGNFTFTTGPTITTNGSNKTITWSGVEFNNLNWTPLSDLKVARFNVNTKTNANGDPNGYAATQYMHDMAVMKNPITVIQGKTGRDAYAGTDPNNWFAPEHFLHTEFTFVTTVNQTNPPILADFDLIEDDISNNWLAPKPVGSGSTKTTLPQSLVRGTAITNTISVNAYKYMAKWVITPDAQSIWSAYQDGDSINIDFNYQQVTGEESITKFIKVDKEVPEYDNVLEIATGTATTPGSWQQIQPGFPLTSSTVSIALNPQTGTWTSGQSLYVKVKGIDSGSGVRDIVTPTVSSTNWTIAPHNPQPAEDGDLFRIYKLTPVNPNNVTASSILTLTFGTVQDSVGHINYGSPNNSTDPNWTGIQPTVTFNFRADYATTHEFIRAYKYLGINTPEGRQDWTTAPYVQAGSPIGVMLKLVPPVPDRGTNVDYIEVSSVELNTKYITNVIGGTDSWVTLANDPVTGVYYLNTDRIVNSNYNHGAGISLQYRINYLIHYTDTTTSTPSPFISAVIQNVGIVDKQPPEFIFANNDPTNPLNQRSVFIWSGSIGPTDEGYVVPGDNDGTVKLIFKDNSGYEDTNTKPTVKFTNLNQFVTGMPATYEVPDDYIAHYNTYSISIDNQTYNYTDVWVASLENLSIYAQIPPIYSTTIGYEVYDVVGNGPAEGDRYVEIAADGPIVPVIRHAEIVTTVPGTGSNVYNYISQGVPATMKFYIHTAEQVYIEDVWIDPVSGVQYGTKSVPVAIDVNDPGNHNANWLVTIPVTPNNINQYDNITFVVHSKRQPFGAPMFTGTFSVPVIVDGKEFSMNSPQVVGIGHLQKPGMVGPGADASITIQFNDIGELIVGDGVTSLPVNIENWFHIQNSNPPAFINIYDPVIDINGNDVLATWFFNSEDINQTLPQNVNQLAFSVNYQNIWGHTASSSWNFNFDQKPPVISPDGITFYNADNELLQTENYHSNNYIANNSDWKKVRFTLNDPDLRTGVVGSGINIIDINLEREAETYLPIPDPLANMTKTYNPAGYIELKFNGDFSAFDLAEGYYQFTIITDDILVNEATYIQRFLYWHQPSQMEIIPPNGSTLSVLDDEGNITQQQVTAFPYDPTGQVQGVQFFLYQDVDANGVYDANVDIDVTAHLSNDTINTIDTIAPYTVMWNFDAPEYKYLETDIYNSERTRKFLLRASILSEGGRAVSDSIVVINVTDNQPPIPNDPIVTGNTEIDYLNQANNILNLTVTFNPEWIDADSIRFEIKDTYGNLIKEITVPNQNGTAIVDWNYYNDNQPNESITPGTYYIYAIGMDIVGNEGTAENYATVHITNPGSNITYNLKMVDVRGFADEEEILDNPIYGANNPAENLGNLRLDADFYNITDPDNGSLEGVSAITFKAIVTNNVTGDVDTVDVINDTSLQPDYPSSGPIFVNPDIMNNTISIFVPDSFYMPAGYNDQRDISYEFFIDLTFIHDAIPQPPVYRSIRLDYYAPVVNITEATPYITWSRGNEFKVTGDIDDVNTIMLNWSRDNTTWLEAQNDNYQTLPFQIINEIPPYILFQNWNTAGGNDNTLLDYEGSVWVKVVATDSLGNTKDSNPVQLYVDNCAPNTPVTHIAYRTHYDVEATEDENAYNTLHALGTLPGEDNHTITVVTSSQDYGTSNLRIYVDPAQITGLSGEAIGENYDWNNMASWYNNNTNDFRPPVHLYHGKSHTNDLGSIEWTSGALYDHETWNGLYGFEIPSTLLRNGGYEYHYFIVAANDTRGNFEGDSADSLGNFFDGELSDLEKAAAIDLNVIIQNIADVEMIVTGPSNNAIVGEWVNLAAKVISNDGNVSVDNVLFQRKVGNLWQDIATVPNSPVSDVKFHLYRKDIPDYDGLPYVPGVHLYVNDIPKGELLWDSATQSWSNTFEFAQSVTAYHFKYYLDLNNDGIINVLDENIANQLGNPNMYKIEVDPNGFNSFEVTPWVTYLNTETLPDGLYEFRAVPIDSQGEPLFNHLSPSLWLHIDNTSPQTTIETIGGVDRIRVVLDPDNVDEHYELAKLVADVEELLVATDDVVTVSYQYSAQNPNAIIRRWVEIDSITSNPINMASNYPTNFLVGDGIFAPLIDNIDNDADGLVDEADEAEAEFYLRAIAQDRAGNYYTSNVIIITVDGNAPLMKVENINGQLMADTQNIFIIPTTGDIIITANDITPDVFDEPVEAYFEYIFRPSVNDNWSSPIPIELDLSTGEPVWKTVTNGSASQLLPANIIHEGYFGFRAVSRDMLWNIDIASTPFTYVVFNDNEGTIAHIVSLGANPNLPGNPPIDIISEEYAFAQNYTYYNGNINIHIDNPLEIVTVTAKWAESENGPWININTVPTNNQENIQIPWLVPVISRAPYIYLQVFAQDEYANTETSEIIKLYVDTIAPNANVLLLTHRVEPISQKKVLDTTENIQIVVEYTHLPEVNLIDVQNAIVRIVNADSTTIVEKSSIFNIVNSPTHSSFLITVDDMIQQGIDDGIYHLNIELTDFAGNTA